MKKIGFAAAFAIILFIFLSITVNAETPSETGISSNNPTLISADSGSCVCTEEYAPVCGENGETYSNKCFAKCAGIEIAYEGKCSDERDCSELKCPNAYYDSEEQDCVCGKTNDACQTELDCENAEWDSENHKCACQNREECKYMHWFDSENKKCGYKKFCGAYMYYGLRTFASKEECYNTAYSESTEPCICTADYSPVCGTNGITYSNKCVAECRGIKAAYEGKCRESQCKTYMDEKGCKVSKCEDGTSRIVCPTAISEQDLNACKQYVDRNGCRVKACVNAVEQRYCPQGNSLECEKFRDENGCTIKKCADGTVTTDCETEEQARCKYYIDENDCKVKTCTDGTIDIRCPNPGLCEDLKCREGYNCNDGKCIAECKKIELGNGCILKKCSNGYTATDCPSEEAIECRRYENEEGCIVKVCANGYERKECPETESETKCKKYREDNGCVVKVCNNGYKARYCRQARNIRVNPEEETGEIETDDENISVAVSETEIETEAGDENISIKKEADKIRIKTKNASVSTQLEIQVRNNEMFAGGKKIVVLPEAAQARLKNEFKNFIAGKMEIKTEGGNLVYAVQGTRKGNLFFLIPVEVPVSANVNAETNNVENIEEPWWGGLAG